MKAKSGKAPGIDGLLADTVETHTSIQILTPSFNKCLRLRHIPTLWTKGMISPIPKSKDSNPHIPLYYRGISLLSVIGKLFTVLMANRISAEFEKSNTLVNEQDGFRPKKDRGSIIFYISQRL